MKLVIDEHVKHRLIGLAVLISLAALFAPAMMKKSNQNPDHHYNVHVSLPPEPNVAVVNEPEVFQTITLAKTTTGPEANTNTQPIELAKAEEVHADVENVHETAALQKPNIAPVEVALNDATDASIKQVQDVAMQQDTLPVVPRVEPVKKIPTVIAKVKVKQAAKVKTNVRKRVSRHEVYAVQLASFSRKNNAQALVSKLHAKGYKAHYVAITGRTGMSYKVYAGRSNQKAEALKLKVQLASVMRLDGFVVTTGVS